MFMMLKSRSLKAMVLIAGILVVGLGMYSAFQAQDAAANNSSWSCLIMYDRIYLSSSFLIGSKYTGKTRIKSAINCSDCRGVAGGRRHTQRQKISSYTYSHHWEHRWPLSSTWSYCHIHTGTSSRTDWVTVRCKLGDNAAFEHGIEEKHLADRGTEEKHLTIRRRFI